MLTTNGFHSVPVSKLPELVYETKKDLAQIGITSTIVGHVGDGNFHALLLFRNDEEMEVAKAAVKRMVKRAIALDGTCTSPSFALDVLYSGLNITRVTSQAQASTVWE